MKRTKNDLLLINLIRWVLDLATLQDRAAPLEAHGERPKAVAMPRRERHAMGSLYTGASPR